MESSIHKNGVIQWIKEIQPHEFPQGVVDNMNPTLFNDILFPLRKKSGVPMTPSPLEEGHVRWEGTSRHSTARGTRLSDASDQFIPSTQKTVYDVLRASREIPSLGGFGIYFDTVPSVMIHVDEREEKLMWLRVGGEYIYEPNNPELYYQTLINEINKLKG